MSAERADVRLDHLGQVSGEQAGDPGARRDISDLQVGSYPIVRQHRGPPAGAHSIIADHEETGRANQEEQKQGAQPAEAEFGRLAALHAGLPYIGGESRPIRVFHHQARGGIGLQESLGPVLLIESDRIRVAADNSFAENASGELTELLLLQRHEVVLADFGDGGYVFQRDAAGGPLHAQVFTKTSHRSNPE